VESISSGNANALATKVGDRENRMNSLIAAVSQPLASRWAPIPIRLMVGYGFMQHGFAKLSRGPDTFAAILKAIGVPMPHVMAWITVLTELFGGLAVLIGAFLPLVSVPLIALLLVAALTVHLPYGFSSIKLMSVTAGRAQFGPPGYECDLLYLACLVALVCAGAGPLSVDEYRMRKRGSRTAL
jgi:putative oxidoreductase